MKTLLFCMSLTLSSGLVLADEAVSSHRYSCDYQKQLASKPDSVLLGGSPVSIADQEFGQVTRYQKKDVEKRRNLVLSANGPTFGSCKLKRVMHGKFNVPICTYFPDGRGGHNGVECAPDGGTYDLTTNGLILENSNVVLGGWGMTADTHGAYVDLYTTALEEIRKALNDCMCE
jgi:hypothetical protein